MLDEYLANEGKLIDERAATFAQSPVCPVVYQLPTKSTSYVRTLDSVLKKQTPTPPSAPSKLLSSPKTSRPMSRPKVPARPKPPKPAVLEAHAPAPASLHGAKPPTKPKSSPKAPRAPGLVGESAGPKDSASRDPSQIGAGQGGASGRSAGLPKTLVKLMDLEDGAVWEGKARTYITRERAEIALASLLTAQVGKLNTLRSCADCQWTSTSLRRAFEMRKICGVLRRRCIELDFQYIFSSHSEASSFVTCLAYFLHYPWYKRIMQLRVCTLLWSTAIVTPLFW